MLYFLPLGRSEDIEERSDEISELRPCKPNMHIIFHVILELILKLIQSCKQRVTKSYQKSLNITSKYRNAKSNLEEVRFS